MSTKVPAQLNNILLKASELGASDVHLHSGARLRVRIRGELHERGASEVPATTASNLLEQLLNEQELEILEKEGQVDLAIQLEDGKRCRANVFRQQHGLDAVFRIIPKTPLTLEELGLPAHLKKLTEHRNGLVLVTGPAGSGKSSTIAALIDVINDDRQDHIITVEDPVEVIHPSKGCIVNQRQVGIHTKGFASALRAALREDPDVIMIGELRDLESIGLAITAAETGHLVFATIHTRTSVESINRIINVFPTPKQPQVRSQLAESLRATITQRLIPTVDKTRRVAALEILISNGAIRGLIRDSTTEHIPSTQQMRRDGMCLMDQSLKDLVRQRVITQETALRYCHNPGDVTS